MFNARHDNAANPGPSISYLIMAATLTFGQRFVIPLGGRYEVGVSLVVCGLVMGYWLFRGQIYLHAMRLMLYLGAVVGIITCSCLNSDDPELSYPKIVYLIVIYAVWMFVHKDPRGPIPFWRYYRLCMTIVAILGLAQFAVQMVGIKLIDVYSLLPEKFVAKGYYSHQPLSWGSQYIKSYGIVLFEPSYYSRMLAIALVIEALFFKQIWRIVLFGAAIIPAFSGTGLIMLGALYPRLLADRPKLVGSLTVGAVILMIPVVLFTSAGQTFLKRATEFSENESSGRMRFIAPITRLIDTFDTHYFYGHGPGTIEEFENVRNVVRRNDRHLVFSFGYSYIKDVEAYPNTFVTILYEIGIFPGLPILAFITYCFFRRSWSYPVSAGMFLYYMILAGDFSQVETLLLCYSLTFMSIRPLATVDERIRQLATRYRIPQVAPVPVTAMAAR
ncbi:MAG TPA: hypothetical protein VMF30_17195 [Pirellulales bacterium]|nr:hypothetical protein [Pirellulales bacterium]